MQCCTPSASGDFTSLTNAAVNAPRSLRPFIAATKSGLCPDCENEIAAIAVASIGAWCKVIADGGIDATQTPNRVNNKYEKWLAA